MSEKSKENFPEFITFPRNFEEYKWYKPLLVLIVGLIVYVILQTMIVAVFNMVYGENVLNSILSGGYETLDTSDASMYLSYLLVAILIPSIYIASRIVHDRPFSSYSSSRGGWNWKLYFKCLIIPLVIYIIYYDVSLVINPESIQSSQISAVAVIVATVLIPAQCIAEEYIFRGYLMQTFGSWFKIPVLAVIIQAILFAVLHSYNSIGVISIFVSGIILGILAWRTNGLEAGSAIHSVNNLLLFYIVALGLGSTSSSISLWEFVCDFLITVISASAIYYIGNKKDWFSEKTN